MRNGDKNRFQQIFRFYILFSAKIRYTTYNVHFDKKERGKNNERGKLYFL